MRVDASQAYLVLYVDIARRDDTADHVCLVVQSAHVHRGHLGRYAALWHPARVGVLLIHNELYTR